MLACGIYLRAWDPGSPGGEGEDQGVEQEEGDGEEDGNVQKQTETKYRGRETEREDDWEQWKEVNYVFLFSH